MRSGGVLGVALRKKGFSRARRRRKIDPAMDSYDERLRHDLSRPVRRRRGACLLRASVVSASLEGPFRVRAMGEAPPVPPLRQEAETDWTDPLPIILRMCRDCEPEFAVRDAHALWDLWKVAQGLSS